MGDIEISDLAVEKEVKKIVFKQVAQTPIINKKTKLSLFDELEKLRKKAGLAKKIFHIDYSGGPKDDIMVNIFIIPLSEKKCFSSGLTEAQKTKNNSLRELNRLWSKYNESFLNQKTRQKNLDYITKYVNANTTALKKISDKNRNPFFRAIANTLFGLSASKADMSYLLSKITKEKNHFVHNAVWKGIISSLEKRGFSKEETVMIRREALKLLSHKSVICRNKALYAIFALLENGNIPDKKTLIEIKQKVKIHTSSKNKILNQPAGKILDIIKKKENANPVRD